MNMNNAKIIEDRFNLVGNQIKSLQERHMHTPIMGIQEIEEWEERLDFLGIPYVLIAIEDGYAICIE